MKNIFMTIINSEVQAEIVADALRTAIVESVIYRTSVKQRVEEKLYDFMKNEAENFISAKTLILKIGEAKEQYSFYFSANSTVKSLHKLMNRLIELDCFYEDIDGYDYEEEEIKKGFCWHNEKGIKCGLYYSYSIAEETVADTADDTATDSAFEEANNEVNNIILATVKKEPIEEEINEAEQYLLTVDYDDEIVW